MRLTRRKFLTTVATGLVAPRLLSASEIASKPGGGSVAPSRVWTSNLSPKEAIPKLLASIPEADEALVKGARIILKPNMSWPNPPEWATTTNPGVIDAVIRHCLDRGAASVLVVDHPLGNNHERCVEKTGIAKTIQELPKSRVFLLSKRRDFIPKKLPQGSQLEGVEIAKELLRSTCVINLPKAKAHSATSVSFGIKNLMGLVLDRQAFHSSDLGKSIAELLFVVRPTLTVLDAITVLTSRGPQGPGEVESPGILAAGTDPVAVDSFACTLARWNGRAVTPTDIDHIRHAEQLGFGSTSYELTEV